MELGVSQPTLYLFFCRASETLTGEFGGSDSLFSGSNSKIPATGRQDSSVRRRLALQTQALQWEGSRQRRPVLGYQVLHTAADSLGRLEAVLRAHAWPWNCSANIHATNGD